MDFRCSDIFEIPLGCSPKLIAGADGLDNIVRWVYLAEALENSTGTLDWLAGGELVVLTGRSFTRNIPNMLVEFIEQSARKRISGVVINVGLYIDKIPTEVVDVAERLKIPLIEIPWETPLVSFIKGICDEIYERERVAKANCDLANILLFCNTPLPDSAQRMLTQYGFDRATIFNVAILSLDESKLLSEQERSDTLSLLSHKLHSSFLRKGIHVLPTLCGEELAIISPLSSEAFLKQLRNVLCETCRVGNTSLAIALGKSCNSIDQLSLAYHTAAQALKVHRYENREGITCFEEIGSYAILLDIRNRKTLVDYYDSLFSALIEYDKINQSTMMQTLDTYIGNNARLLRTAEALFIHENTLKYRLNRIKELISVDISSLQGQSEVILGFQIGRMLGQCAKDS